MWTLGARRGRQKGSLALHVCHRKHHELWAPAGKDGAPTRSHHPLQHSHQKPASVWSPASLRWPFLQTHSPSVLLLHPQVTLVPFVCGTRLWLSCCLLVRSCNSLKLPFCWQNHGCDVDSLHPSFLLTLHPCVMCNISLSPISLLSSSISHS